MKRFFARCASSVMLSLALLVAGALAPPLASQASLFVAPALADDDDGGGDDDDGGSSGGPGLGGRSTGGKAQGRASGSFFRLFDRGIFKSRPAQRRQTARRAAPVPVDSAPRELATIDLGEAGLAALEAEGFSVLARDRLEALGSTVTRLAIPASLSLDAARSRVVALAPAAVDLNHYYRPQERDAQACLTADCLARNLIDWHPAETASCALEVSLGMIDTAVNRDHDALRNARLEVVRLADAEARPSGAQHGTAVASLFVAETDSRAPGLLPGARLIAVDTFSGGRDDLTDVYSLVRGLDLLVTRRVRVVNLSLSGPDNALLARAVTRAALADVVLVAAAGNGGPRARPAYPAAYPEVVAVTAVDRARRIYRRAVRGAHVDIAAPGVAVWTAASISGARQKSGTSFAAPFVSAAAALYRAGNPAATRAEVIAALTARAEDLGDPGRDDVFGWGLVQPRGLCLASTPVSR